jgi:hypothetical protein
MRGRGQALRADFIKHVDKIDHGVRGACGV